MDTLSEPKHIVIIGAGFAGLNTALVLARFPILKEKGYDVILIDRHHHHLYTPALYEIAAIPAEYLNDESLVSSILIPLRDIIRGRAIRVLTDDIIGRDPATRTLLLRKGGALPYAYLVVALGTETNYFDIPGLQSHSIPLKTCDDAVLLRNTIETIFRKKSSLAIVVGGGGASGVEMVAELVNFVCLIKEKIDPRRHNFSSRNAEIFAAARKDDDGVYEEYTPRRTDAATVEISNYSRKGYSVSGLTMPDRGVCNVSFTLAEASSEILPGFNPWIASAARRRLEYLGVAVKTGVAIASCDQETVTFADGTELMCDILIWTGGVKGPAILADLHLPLSPKGTVSVGPDLRVAGGDDTVFAVGDNAWFLHPDTQKPLPWNVPVAEAEGRHAAHEIVRAMSGGARRPFQPRRRYPFILAVGEKYALADFVLIRFSGFAGWCAKQLVQLRYFLFLLPWPRAVSLWWKNIKMYRSND